MIWQGCGPLIVILSTLLASCAVGPDYHPATSSELGVPSTYIRGPGAALDEAELASWWERFNDPALDQLVDATIAANLDLEQAKARLRQARESTVQAESSLFPSVSASGGVGRNISNRDRDTSSFSLGLDASWQVDLFGGIRRSVEAAEADEEATEYDLASVRIALIAEMASNYIQLRQSQEALAVTQETIRNQQDNYDIARWRVQAGLLSSLDEESARTQLAQTKALLPAIESNINGAAYRIAVLIAQPPGAVRVPEMKVQAPGTVAFALDAAEIPKPPAGLAEGIPTDTLRQRPDVRAAERALAAATARVGVAEAQLLPSLGLAGSVGTVALSTGGLFDVITGSLFAGISQVLFDGGARASQVRSQEAAVDGAFAAYRQTILLSMEDVENALVAIDTADHRVEQFSIAYDAANNSVILARLQYQSGLIDFQTLRTNENALLSAHGNLIEMRGAQAQAVVQLYNALGGGWQSTDINGNGQ